MKNALLDVCFGIGNEDGDSMEDGIDLFTLWTIEMSFLDVVSRFLSNLKNELVLSLTVCFTSDTDRREMLEVIF